MTLQYYLLENNISIREFAKLMDKPHNTVFRWVNGITEIPLREAYKVLIITDGIVCPHDFIQQYSYKDSIH